MKGADTRYLAVDVALGHFARVAKINVKGTMTSHLETVTEGLDIEKEMERLQDLFTNGHLYDFCELVNNRFHLTKLGSYWNVWLMVSLL